ncbi:MAG TPA: cytochrome c oxidase subunit 3 [Gemmatimonadales bacterium]|nr:cytochrome c oxidase subunit 3 [Gemmatimonadales bacterium]
MSDPELFLPRDAAAPAVGPTAPVSHVAHVAVEASPLGLPSRNLAIWLFITADAATFGAILFGYGYLRVGSPTWSRPFAFVPTILNAVIMTVILLTSSLTMLAATRAAEAGRREATVRRLGATVLLGLAFAGLHLREWFAMIAEGWRPGTNPLGGPPIFGATFFSITGLHLLHVVGGVVALVVIALGVRSGRFGAGHVETTGLYWHFVDLVWMFVFPLVYLMNAR